MTAETIRILVTLPYFCVNSDVFCQYLLCTVLTYTLFASIDSFWGLPDQGKFATEPVMYVNDPKCIDTIDTLSVAMVANNIGRAETQIGAGNSRGVLHRAVPNHKFNQIFLKGWTIATNFRPEYLPHRTNFRSKFRVALTPSRIMSPKVLMFHIYIKVRRILFEMGGIQSEWLFQVTRLSAGYIIIMTRHRSNEYAEFGISPSADFRFKEGDNHGLGSVSVYVSYVGPEADHSTAYLGRKKFSDEGGKAIEEVLWFSRTLLLSIFCYLLLHNFSLFVSFIKFFTVNFIHSELPFNCLNRLTVSTPFINHFTSLYIVSNLPFGPYLAQRFNRLKCPFRFNTSVNFVCALDICEWFWPQYLMSSTSWETLKIIASTYSFLHFLEKKCKNINCCWEHSD